MGGRNRHAPAAVEAAAGSLLPAVEEVAIPRSPFRRPRPGATRFTIAGSPIGDLLLAGDGEALTGLWMLPDPRWGPDTTGWVREATPFTEACQQLAAYFAGELRHFDLPLAPRASAFQERVWSALLDIPYGSTRTYGAIAHRVGTPLDARAVGAANGRNPISIVIPCHRVIGAGGDLVGYGGGLPLKAWLLSLERTGRPPRPLA